jgi:hypothetical protein
MAETGRPLIPREVLPAPVPPAAKRSRRPSPASAEAGRQLSIFGAETTEPSPFDLAALLAGPGRLDRMGGTARVSVRVDAAWRVHVLVAELVSRGLVVNWRPYRQDQDPEAEVRPEDSPDAPETPAPADERSANPGSDEESPATTDEIDDTTTDADDPEPEPDPDQEPDLDQEPELDQEPGTDQEPEAGQEPDPEPAAPAPVMFEVRTAYSSRLKALATAWPTASDQLFLTGPRLRLWVAAAGRPTPGGYALGLDPDYSASNKEATGAALRRAGLEGVLANGDSHYLIMGRRRLARLAELVGECPAAAPAELWPGGATA